MAKYTELFAEYLQGGGQLPASFASISGFTDMFTGYYADKEIGFETEALFALKLQTYADIYIPEYQKKLFQINYIEGNLLNPQKVRETVQTLGENVNYRWVLPFNTASATSANASDKALSEQTINNDTVTERGYTPSEIMDIIDKLKGEQRFLMRELIEKFKPCFMMIY